MLPQSPGGPNREGVTLRDKQELRRSFWRAMCSITRSPPVNTRFSLIVGCVSNAAITTFLRAILAWAALVGGCASLGAANTAVSFDGVNDYVTFGPAPGLGSATF